MEKHDELRKEEEPKHMQVIHEMAEAILTFGYNEQNQMFKELRSILSVNRGEMAEKAGKEYESIKDSIDGLN